MSQSTQTQKQHAKALKGPDAFQVRIMGALDWAVKNVKLIAMGVAPVAAIALGVFAWQYFNKTQKNARLDQLGGVQVLFDEELRQAADKREVITKQIEELAKKSAAAAPASADPTKPTPPPPEDPAVKAQREALEKQAEAIQPDHSGSLVKFQEYFNGHKDQPEGWMAGMKSVSILTSQDKVAEARPILETILQNAKGNEFYQTQARLSLIGVLEEAGEFDKALTEVDVLDKTADKELKPKVLLTKGRLQLLKNDKEGAKATFAALESGHAATPEAAKARSMAALVN